MSLNLDIYLEFILSQKTNSGNLMVSWSRLMMLISCITLAPVKTNNIILIYHRLIKENKPAWHPTQKNHCHHSSTSTPSSSACPPLLSLNIKIMSKTRSSSFSSLLLVFLNTHHLLIRRRSRRRHHHHHQHHHHHSQSEISHQFNQELSSISFSKESLAFSTTPWRHCSVFSLQSVNAVSENNHHLRHLDQTFSNCVLSYLEIVFKTVVFIYLSYLTNLIISYIYIYNKNILYKISFVLHSPLCS